MTSGSFRSVSRPRNRRKSQSARLRVLASQLEVALDRSEAFLRNQDPERALGRSDRTDCLPILARRKVLGSGRR
jgi:hypothetical protein